MSMNGVEEKKLRIVRNENALTKEDIDKLFSGVDDSKLNKMAEIVAMKVNTMTTNDILKETNGKLDKLENGIAELINSLKKQSVDENNSSFKVARRDNPNAIEIKSLDSHITHIISFVHIADCYKLKTNKGDKISYGKARKMLIDLNLIDDKNFKSKQLSGSSGVSNKYHLDILVEVKNRLQNANKYGIDPEKCLHWRQVCLIPDDNEIKIFINDLLSLLSE